MPAIRGDELDFEGAMETGTKDGVALQMEDCHENCVEVGVEAARVAPAAGKFLAATPSSGTITGTWTLVAPGTVSSITAPAVSNIVASRVPSASATLATPVVMVVEADFAPSYDALRAQPGVFQLSPQLLGGGSGSHEAPLLPVDGTLKYSAVTVNGD